MNLDTNIGQETPIFVKGSWEKDGSVVVDSVMSQNDDDDLCVCVCVCVCARVRSVMSDSRDYTLPGSSVHGIFQARMLECVVISSFRGSSRPRDQVHVSCTGRRVLHYQRHLGSPDGV